MGLPLLDWIVVAVYAVCIFGLAQWVSRERAGHAKDSADYFLASKSLPWWAIGTSLIAANISAEQIVGMSGSGYAIGLAIASYEWMAALTLLIVGKFFLPIFLRNQIYTMPQFLEQRYGRVLPVIMAVFWLALYVFVNLTSIVWLGSIAVNRVAGVDQDVALFALGLFALLYQLYGGLKAVALTDFVQVTLLVLGGLVVSYLTLDQVGSGQGPVAGFAELVRRAPDHFHMILSSEDPHYADLPGLSVLIGGMWIANLSYWGFNQYIIQRALAAKTLGEAQKGVVFAAYLKLIMPAIIVLPGIAAVVLAPDLTKPDEAYPTMMRYLPTGLLGLVFAALIAAIVASTASKINSIATIFTLDLYAKARGIQTRAEDGTPVTTGRERHLVLVGRAAAAGALIIALLTARPLLGKSDQAFQFIQEFSGFFTPGITVIFLLGLFWKRANEAGAIAAAVTSVLLSYALKAVAPGIPFMDRMALVFVASLAIAVVLAFVAPAGASNRITVQGLRFSTPATFNAAGIGVILILTGALRDVVVMTSSFLAVDWGTTNRRVYRFENGGVAETERDGRGVRATTDFAQEVAAIRSRFGDLPMLLAGMVGSTIGWRDAGYLPTPAGIDDLGAGLCRIDERTAIVPGLRTGPTADVMRGEEVQFLGAVLTGAVPNDALLVQPGTHCKWARLVGRRIVGFTTAMTGELFALLRDHSVLSPQLQGPVEPDVAFLAGVREGQRRDLGASLFAIRAAELTGLRDRSEAPSYASGVLIGAEIAARTADYDEEDVYLLADEALGDVYTAALVEAGRRVHRVDSHRAFAAGIKGIAAQWMR